MNWKIELSNNAVKDLKKLDNPVKKRIWEYLKNLDLQDPSHEIKKLKGNSNEYRLRIGDWRIKFVCDRPQRICLITHIKHRRDVYD